MERDHALAEEDGPVLTPPLTTSGAKETLQLLARTPSARIVLGFTTGVVVPVVLILVVVQPLFSSLFPDDPVATHVRHGLQLALVLGFLYLGIRVMRLNDSRNRTAAFTRMLVGAIAILFLPSGLLFGVLEPLLSRVIPHGALAKAAGEIVMIPGVVALYSFLYAFYEKRAIRELSRKGCLRELGLGFAVGTALPSLTVLFLYVSGHYTVVSVNPVSVLAYALISLAFVSCQEELFFRGVIYRICETRLGTHAAVVVSATVFGAAHLLNENVSLAGIISAATGGALLGVLFSLTGRLWIPMSFHLGWNLSQVFFGSNVSGVTEYGRFLDGWLEGSRALTGGAFGIETSVPLLILLLLFTVFVYYQVIKRGRLVRPFWKGGEPDSLNARRVRS